MSEIQVSNENFNSASNWLKKERKVNKLYDIAEIIAVERKEFDRFRNGSKKISRTEIEKLLSTFPEWKWFKFEEKEIYSNQENTFTQKM